MPAISVIPGRLLDNPPTVVLARVAGVPDEFWFALPVRLAAIGSNPHEAEETLRIPLHRFLAGRRWLSEHCRSFGVGLDLDDRIKENLRRGRDEQSVLSGILRRGSGFQPSAPDDIDESKRLLTRDLRPFQRRDLAKLLSLPHGANFSVPGAGKTTVCYALHDSERARGRVQQMLVVAPISAFEAWETEAEECFDTPPVVRRYDGTIPRDTDVLLTNYQRLREPHLSRLTAWASSKPTHLVLDEAHRMKRGRTGEWGRACLELAYAAERRDVLTGTPAPQSPRDLVALVDFIWPNQGRAVLPPLALSADPPPESMALVHEAIDPLFVRTTKHELGLDTPHLHTHVVEMDALQANIYDALRNRYAGMFDLTRDDRSLLSQMGEVVMYLVEAATNPALLRQRTSSQALSDFIYPSLAIPAGSSLSRLIADYPRHEVPPKFLKVSQMVEANARRGLKTLVWSNLVGNLLSLERILSPHQPALVYGGTPSFDGAPPPGVRTREGELSRFRTSGDCHVLLANPAAMAEGVSLHHECHDAIYLDRTFNAGQYLQSLDRIHRLGLPPGTETRITFLVSEGTIDEQVNDRVAAKATNLALMLDDAHLVEMALPDDEDFGQPIEDEIDLRLLLEHLRADD